MQGFFGRGAGNPGGRYAANPVCASTDLQRRAAERRGLFGDQRPLESARKSDQDVAHGSHECVLAGAGAVHGRK
jgi:hypothetical protein